MWMVETHNAGYATNAKGEMVLTQPKFAWIYRVLRVIKGAEQREYLAGTAGRIHVCHAQSVADAMNEWSLTTGEGR